MVCFRYISVNTLHKGDDDDDDDDDGAGIAYSAWRLFKGWTVRGSNLPKAKFFALVQTGPGDQPVSCIMSTGSLAKA
jgi:hypothetical protein